MFKDRRDGGRKLAALLEHLRGEDLVVLGLPRGGVPVAYEVAHALGAPLDVIVVRKLGVPYQPELAMGAIGEGGVRIINRKVMRMAGVDEEEFEAVEHREREELERRARLFRGARPAEPLNGRLAVIVDDGIATGSTVSAATQVARAQGANRVIVAAPVAPREMFDRLQADADELIVAFQPEPFFAIGEFYRDFSQTQDREVSDLLERAAADTHPYPRIDPSAGHDQEVEVVAGDVRLPGHLTIPPHATGIVIFAHGSGSSRHSPRNRMVAESLNLAGLGTLLFDLLTPDDEPKRALVFDIEFLSRRLVAATTWLGAQPEAVRYPFGFFGASTGAAAALWAAAELGSRVQAVVSRGGRPDLAIPKLAEVRSPTLFIVGGADPAVLELNIAARRQMRGEVGLEVVPGATHLFEEPGALEAVGRLARRWFTTHFSPVLKSSAPVKGQDGYAQDV